MSSSRPKRSAAIACTTTMKGINWSDIETEDHQEESPSKKLRNESQQTLEEIIQNVASCKSESDSDPWSQLYQRILERPSEITPRHLLSALQICHPDRNLELPPKLICEILKSDKEMLHFECIRHLTTCPWMPLATIETIFNQEMTQILKDDDFLGNNYASPRFDAFVSNCGKVLELLNFPEEQTPPRLDAVDVILETIGLPIFHWKNCVQLTPWHFACRDERNEEYLLLLARHAKDLDLLVLRQHDEEEDGPYEPYYGGIFVSGSTMYLCPLHHIALYWDDAKAAEVFDKILDCMKLPNDKLAYHTDLLLIAIRNEKYALAKRIVHRVPEILKSSHALGLTIESYCSRSLSFPGLLDLIQLMVEQGVRVAHTGTEAQKKYCGGLLFRHYYIISDSPRRSCWTTPLKVLYTNAPSVAMKLCSNLIRYFTMDVFDDDSDSDNEDESSSASSNEVNVIRIISEAINIRAWDIVRNFINSHPELLFIKDRQNSVVLHHLCESSHTPLDLIQVAIEEGVRYQGGRGGLAIENDNKLTPLNLLGPRKCGSNSKLFKFLIEAKPKLIMKRDYKRLKLLHSVAKNGKVSVAKQLIKACPQSISFVDDNGQLPIHLTCSSKILAPQAQLLRYFLKEGVKQKIGGDKGKGGLMVKGSNGRTALDLLLGQLIWWDRRNWVRTLNVLVVEGIVHDVPIVQSLLQQNPDRVHLLPHIIERISLVQLVIETYEDTLTVRDAEDRLPLHVFMENQFSYPHDKKADVDACYEQILEGNPGAVGEIDTLTNLYPCMIAASQSSRDLSDVYSLLRRDPSIVTPSL